MDPQELLLIAFRATIVYFAVLLSIRVMGKREIGTFNAFDLIVSLIIGESVDEAIYGDVTMVKFLVLLVTIGGWHLLNSWASYKSKKIDRLTAAEASIIIRHGKVDEKALAKERMNEDEMMAELRLLGVDDLKEIKQAAVEPNGWVSLLKEEWAEPVQKGDIPGLIRKTEE